MKILITDYTFSIGSPNTLTLNDVNVPIEQLMYVSNITRGTVIFEGTEKRDFELEIDGADTVITIDFCPDNWEETDKFQIYYDDLDNSVDISFPDFLPVTSYEPLEVDFSELSGLLGRGEYSAFGEQETVSPFPLVQVDFVYGINTGLGTTEAFGLGTASKAVGLPHLLLQTGAAADSWARYFTTRYLKYRSGQGLSVRFSSMFTTGVAGSI